MIRGEIWTVAGGVYASRARPALIVQDDVFDGTASVIVLPFTTTRVDARLLRVSIPASSLSGLERDSDVMIDKITTVRRQSVDARIGRVTAAQLGEVERLMMIFLGLAR